jgi:hypothetical protein
VLDEGFPVFLGSIADGRGNHAKIQCVLVGGDIKLAFIIINVVLVAVFPRYHNFELAFGIVGSEVLILARSFGL